MCGPVQVNLSGDFVSPRTKSKSLGRFSGLSCILATATPAVRRSYPEALSLRKQSKTERVNTKPTQGFRFRPRAHEITAQIYLYWPAHAVQGSHKLLLQGRAWPGDGFSGCSSAADRIYRGGRGAAG